MVGNDPFLARLRPRAEVGSGFRVADRPVNPLVRRSGDDNAVDVREDATSFLLHGCNDRALPDIDNDREVIKHHDAVARALFGRAGDRGIKAAQLGLVQRQVSAINPLLGVTAELDTFVRSLKHVAKARRWGCRYGPTRARNAWANSFDANH